MADSLETIQAKLVSLRNARDTGALIVKHGDTSTTYRNLKEINDIIADLEGQVLVLEETPRPKRRYTYMYSKGY